MFEMFVFSKLRLHANESKALQFCAEAVSAAQYNAPPVPEFLSHYFYYC
jgi:hypothetical protein